MENHLAFLMNCPSEGKFMMFPDYYENMKEEIDSTCEEIEFDLTNIRWSAELKNTQYKVFKVKSKTKIK